MMGATSSPYVIDYAASFDLPAAPAQVWDAIERSGEFEGWWGWLSNFELDGAGLVNGSVLTGVVSPPVPYRMRVRVELYECDRPHSIDASVDGDLVGRAGLLLEPEGFNTRASVAWTLEMTQSSMRLAWRVAPHLLRWGHDRVVEATVRGFKRQLGVRS